MPDLSAFDIASARRKAWATGEKLNPKTIELAARYPNLDNTFLRVASDFEDAIDLPAGDIREQRMHKAWTTVCGYVRVLAGREVVDAA